MCYLLIIFIKNLICEKWNSVRVIKLVKLLLIFSLKESLI